MQQTSLRSDLPKEQHTNSKNPDNHRNHFQSWREICEDYDTYEKQQMVLLSFAATG